MTQTIEEKLVQHVEITGVAMKKAAAEISASRQSRQKAATLIPHVVDALVANERINPASRAKMAAALADPATALEILMKVAAHRIAGVEQPLGKPAGEKQASAQPAQQFRPVGGAGHSAEPARESTKRLYASLGLTPPAFE